jgi:predicted  nucleic acid-binding Zn-ribbon protein
MQADVDGNKAERQQLAVLRRACNEVMTLDEEACARQIELEEELAVLRPEYDALRAANRRVLEGVAHDIGRLDRLAFRQQCRPGAIEGVAPDRSEATLTAVVEEREQVHRDLIMDSQEKLETSAQLDGQLRSLYVAHDKAARTVNLEHDELLAKLGQAFHDFEARHLEAAYRTACEVNKELRFHTKRGTSHLKSTVLTPAERELRQSLGEQQRELAKLTKEVEAAERELAALRRAAAAIEDERVAAQEQFELDREDRVKVMNEFTGFVSALRQEHERWRATKTELEALEKRARAQQKPPPNSRAGSVASPQKKAASQERSASRTASPSGQ